MSCQRDEGVCQEIPDMVWVQCPSGKWTVVVIRPYMALLEEHSGSKLVRVNKVNQRSPVKDECLRKGRVRRHHPNPRVFLREINSRDRICDDILNDTLCEYHLWQEHTGILNQGRTLLVGLLHSLSQET